MNSREIRHKFFDFFVKNGHTKVASSSLIPADDPTLLFANAGMNQFKDVFLGKEQRSYKRAVTIQKCIRAGGKHNDLENVGFTQRHLTFFEMMGNFSFGDYFKREAIRFAWDFLTKEVNLPSEKLYASVYKQDDEAYAIWNKEIGLPENRIVRLGEADNFWQMGDTGPCGPCTEIYLDRGTSYGCGKSDCAPGCSCDRFMEIWNNVFMQFNRDQKGTLHPLTQTGVDTGMGLERLCVAVQQKESVFDTDIFMPLIQKIEQLSGRSYQKSSSEIKAAFRVLADHIRSSSFAIADGALPSNEGRGYVLRKIIRRAALFSQKLTDKAIFAQLAPTLIEQMHEFYPELATQQELIISVLESEIEKFAHNLTHGQAILKKYIEESRKTGIITGAQAFKLYDTYGFPLELTKVIAHEAGYTVDVEGFEQEMEQQRIQSGKKQSTQELTLHPEIKTEFTGYTQTEKTSRIIALIQDNEIVTQVPAGQTVWIVTEQSPLYVECGGQINDTAVIAIDNKHYPVTQIKKVNNAILAEITPDVTLTVGQQVTIHVDRETRLNTMKNHTATHLLQAALMKTLGTSVKQSGSLVTPEYLRFDFTYHDTVKPQEISAIEDIVNKNIMANIPVVTTVTTYADAISKGVIAFFGDKYNPENVRVVEVPGVSAELCGGTHVSRTGDIGVFKITEVQALSAGNRRIVALTGPQAVKLYQDIYSQAKQAAQEFKVPVTQVGEAVSKQREQLKLAQSEIKELKKQALALRIPVWIEQIQEINGLPFLFIETEADTASLRIIIDELLKKKPALYFVLSKHEGRNLFMAQISSAYAQKVSLKELLDWLKLQGFVGGGSNTSIQGSASVVDTTIGDLIKKWLMGHIK